MPEQANRTSAIAGPQLPKLHLPNCQQVSAASFREAVELLHWARTLLHYVEAPEPVRPHFVVVLDAVERQLEEWGVPL